ncbi:hypothetical protein BDQ17DRAFT_1427388 [Cyathus striatus]|nr:hypothetical protein BDQ17DRAFT_1427388 [Cyathus striatus]
MNLTSLWISLGDDAANISALPLNPGSVALVYKDPENGTIADDHSTIYPPGKGFVRLNDKYYLITMYHQVHCVRAFSKTIQEYKKGNRTIPDDRREHLIHCLSYLRQGVLCNSDVALEPAHLGRTVNGEIVHAAYGDDVTHECRDWTEVYAWAEKNYKEWENEDNFEVV